MLRKTALATLAIALLPAFASVAGAAAVTRNFIQTANMNEWPPNAGSPFGAGYSSCWSYIHPDGREYAVIGTTAGTAIYNVTNPYAIYRVGLINGPSSAWREMKSYRNWIYIVTEGTGAGQGVQIVRMTNPEAPVLAATYTGSFVRSHTVSVDTARALLICNGTRNGAGQQTGVRVLSLANPEAPVEVGAWPGGAGIATELYVHDSVPVGSRLYASSIYGGIQRILDFTNPAAMTELSGWSYFGAFTHNAWPDPTGKYLYVTDETNGEPLKVFDITNPATPTLVNTLTSNPAAIVHNAHVLGDELYLANYTEGIRALDISDPIHPAEFGYADSYPGVSGGFWGVWGVCPYFPSGTVIASDMQTGLYVYRPVRDYGVVRAVVTEPPGTPVPGIRVNLPSAGDSLTTGGDGIVQFAPNPGTHKVRVTPFGYYGDSADVNVAAGARDTVQLTIRPRPLRDLQGVIRDAPTLAGLEAAELDLHYTGIHLHTIADGTFFNQQLPEDVYEAEARAAGHIPALNFLIHHQQFSPDLDIPLPRTATWDNLEAASGWVVGGAGTGDNATSGIWTRVEPLGTGIATGGASAAGGSHIGPHRATPAALAAQEFEKPGATPLHGGHESEGAAPGDIQPELDHTPPPGVMCFVTGQGTLPGSPDQADVDNGKTSLTSPTFDLTGMTDPVIGFWRWFYAAGSNDDFFTVQLSNNNGASWVPVDTLHGVHTHWTEAAVHVVQYLTPAATMKIRFIAADLNPASIVEAAVDDIVTYDGANAPLVSVGTFADANALRFHTAFPNPASGNVRLVLELPRSGPLAVDVLDVQGRRVRSLESGTREAGVHTLIWNGRDDSGRASKAGLYFIRARAGGAETRTRVVRVE